MAALPAIKTLLALLSFWHFAAWLFVIIATAITDWSKSNTYEWGIWSYCVRSTGTCSTWVLSENAAIKDCEGALTATRAFSVLSIIFLTFCLCLSVALLAKPTLISKTTVMVNVCMVLITNLWTFLGWIMYLGVEARGQCAFKDYNSWLGSSWFLQLFAWIFGLIAIILSVLIFMKWKQTPRYAGQPPYVPGPVPYGPAAGSYPQYPVGAPYKYPATPPYVPYVGTSYAPAYPGYYGPTPNVSPHPLPTPTW